MRDGRRRDRLGHGVWLLVLLLGCGAPRVKSFKVPERSRVLVVAPHPDDETIAAGGLIAQLARQHVPVRVVFVTDGDGWLWAVASALNRPHPTPADYRRLGEIRKSEAVRAAGALGLPASAVEFLGYPDGGLAELPAGSRARQHPFRSPFTERIRPADRAASPSRLNIRDDLVADLVSVLRAAAPTLLVVPHPDDVHPDHAAVPCLVAEALARAVAAGAAQPTILGYIVHNPGWPPASPERPAPMPLPPQGSVRGTWVSVALAPADLTAKTAALRAHASQLAASGEFLQRFLRTTEPFVRDPTRWCPTAPSRSHADRP